MAFSVTALQGFKPYRKTAHREAFYLPGANGTTFTRGERAKISSGVVTAASGSDADAFLTIAETVTTPAQASANFPSVNEFNAGRYGLDTKYDTLVKCYVEVPAGLPVHLAKLKNFTDEVTIAGYTSGTPSFQGDSAVGSTADDYPNNALCYVYEGAGAGQWNIITDYDHSGHSDGAKTYVLARPFATDLDTTSSLIVLAGEASATRGIPLLGRADLADKDELDTSDGADDGDYTIFTGAEGLRGLINNGWVPVVRSIYLYT